MEGVSVVAHRVMDLTGCDAYFLLVEMEGRVFVTARSRGGRVDVAAALRAVGGGGHTAAASAVVKDQPLDEVAAAVAAAAPAAVAPDARRASTRSTRPGAIADTTAVDDAALRCRRDGLGGVRVAAAALLVGRVALADLERASAHGLGHAPVKAVMTSRVPLVWAADAARARGAASRRTRSAGCRSSPTARRRRDEVVASRHVLGVVTRRSVAGGAGAPSPPRPWPPTSPGRLESSAWTHLLRHVQAVAAGVRGCYLVGGAVRDLLLGEPGFDVDLAVEGDGIAFANDLAARLKGHVRPHEKFGTAVVVARRRAASACASTSPPRAPSPTSTRRRCPRWSTRASAATSRVATSPSTRWRSR